MKKTISLVLVLVLVWSLTGCGKKRVIESLFPKGTQPTTVSSDEPQDGAVEEPTQETTEDTASTVTVTESLELDLYEEYISTVANCEYRYVDLDGDGEQELFISPNMGESEIVTISDGEIVHMLSAYHLFLCDGGIIGRWSEGSGGQTLFYYKIENHEAVFVDVITMTHHDDAWYHSTDITDIRDVALKTMNPITKEDAYEIIEQYVLLEDSIPYYLTLFYSELE